MINKKVILASASPRRKELIAQVVSETEICPAECDETLPDGISPREAVEYLSKIKNDAVRVLYGEDDIIVSADTVVAVGDEILGKPSDKEDARRMMKLLSGKTHSVYTGVTLSRGATLVTFSEKTDVEFYPMSKQEIENYLSADGFDWSDKAGAYAIQGKAAVFIKGISGDYYNVVGLPISRLYRELSSIC